jgi:thioredoxin reductase
MTDHDHDLAVVGAGPAGLAAAVTAAEQGLHVALVDAAHQPGGQFWRHPDESFPAPDEARGQHLWSRFTDLRARLYALESGAGGSGRIDRVAGHQVWFLERGPETSYTLHLTPTVLAGTRDATTRVRAASLVLCPGGYDRQLPVPGWDLPGVMTAGGVQALLKAHRSIPGRRAVVAGTGPFLLPVAQGLAEAGATVVAVCEANAVTGWVRSPLGAAAVPSKAVEAAAYAGALLRHRVPFRTRTVVTEVLGVDRVRSVRLGRLDREGRLRSDAPTRELDVDLVAFGWGFSPSVELVTAVGGCVQVDADESLVAIVDEWQRSDAPGVYVAGEATGVGGAVLALVEGELAGLAACRDQGRRVPERVVRRLQRRVRRGRAFAGAMHGAYPVPAGWQDWLRPDTTVCRCEEVTVADVHTACDRLDARDARTVKLLARPGMGWCQGRVCGFATARMALPPGERPSVADLASTAKRTLAAAVALGELASAGDEQPFSPEHDCNGT